MNNLEWANQLLRLVESVKLAKRMLDIDRIHPPPWRDAKDDAAAVEYLERVERRLIDFITQDS